MCWRSIGRLKTQFGPNRFWKGPQTNSVQGQWVQIGENRVLKKIRGNIWIDPCEPRWTREWSVSGGSERSQDEPKIFEKLHPLRLFFFWSFTALPRLTKFQHQFYFGKWFIILRHFVLWHLVFKSIWKRYTFVWIISFYDLHRFLLPDYSIKKNSY